MRPCRHTMTFAWLISFLALLPSAVTAQGLPADPEVIILRADPEIIAADGQSTATVLAEVRNRDGTLVADGTVVRFTTTAGTIAPSMETRGGVVRAILRSAAAEGVAEITATAGPRAVARTKVIFSAQPLALAQIKPVLRAEAQSLQYVPEKDLIDAAGAARVSYRGVLVLADLLQIHVESMKLVAHGNVKVRSLGKEITADRLSLRLQEMQGLLVAMEPNGGIRRQAILSQALDVREFSDRTPDGAFDLVETCDANATMSARKLTLFPQEKIQFSGFGLRVAGAHIVTFPFYVLSLNPYGPNADPMVSLDTTGGLSLNLPFYYSVTDNFNGSVRLRRQTRYGYDGYNTRPGWQLAFDQRYNWGQRNNGQVDIDHVTTRDWGLRWRHEQQFGSRTHTYLSLDTPAHHDLYARTEVQHSMGLGDLSWSAYGSFLPEAKASMQSRLYLRLKPATLGRTKLRYYWTGNVAWSRYGDQSTLEEGLDLQMHPPGLRLGQTTNLQFYWGTGYTFSSVGPGPTAQATASLTKSLGKSATGILRYNFYYSGRKSEYYGATTNQSVTGQIYAGKTPRWSTSLTATYVPDSGDVSVYGSAVYSPLKNWRVEMRPSYSWFGGAGYLGYRRDNLNLDVYLVRQLGTRDVALRWSTLDKKIRLELAATALRF